jgi:hypothetical protein
MLQKNKLPIIFLILLSFLTFYRVFRPGIWSSQDEMHLFRLQQFHQCLADGQIPCRFIRDGGMGYGYPLFNYYSPLVYIVAEFFHLLGLNFVNSLKLTFVFSNLLAPLGMYLLVSRLWNRPAALLSAIFFLFAPYRAVDFYVRGALAEFTALNLLPFLFWSYLQNNFYLTIIISTIFLLSHNLYSLLALPFVLLWILYQKKLTRLYPFFVSFCLSAFFLLPSLLEKSLVTLPTMIQGYFDFKAHFLTLKQLFLDRSWGFGASLWGPKDDMSFQIGILHYATPIILFLINLIRRQKLKSTPLIYSCLIFSLFLTFLTHNRSLFFWQVFPSLAYLQFPWRLLGFIVFFLSLITGPLLVSLLSGIKQKIILLILSLTVIIFNIDYFKEDIWYPSNNDDFYLNPQTINQKSSAGLRDYWPIYGSTYPKDPAPTKPFSDQTIKIISFTKTSRTLTTEIKVEDKSAAITLPLVYFPHWSASLDHQPTTFHLQPELGLIQLNVPSGYHHIYLEFSNTPVRNFANILSLLTLLFILIQWHRTKK